MTVLVLTYHAIEQGPAPLCLDPETFERHLDAIAAAGAVTLTVRELAARLRERSLPERAVALTFDDACASAVEVAAPMLRERGVAGTFFCVAGHLGSTNDWPTQQQGAPRLRLAGVESLRTLAAAGFEIGSHGMSHAPLDGLCDAVADRELRSSKDALEGALDTDVASFASPYGAAPRGYAATVLRATYAAACTTRLRAVGPGADPLGLPRVDAHYLRRPQLLRRALAGGLGPYLATRRVAARARRTVLKDYTPAATSITSGGSS